MFYNRCDNESIGLKKSPGILDAGGLNVLTTFRFLRAKDRSALK